MPLYWVPFTVSVSCPDSVKKLATLMGRSGPVMLQAPSLAAKSGYCALITHWLSVAQLPVTTDQADSVVVVVVVVTRGTVVAQTCSAQMQRSLELHSTAVASSS